MAFIAYLVVFVFAVPIADLFNKDKNPLLTSMAAEGMRIYFVSLFFSGINMVSATYLSASDQPVPGFIISILRGLVLILPIPACRTFWNDRYLALPSCYRGNRVCRDLLLSEKILSKVFTKEEPCYECIDSYIS